MKKLFATFCLTVVLLPGCGGESEDYTTALREWAPLAKQGNADAQYNLGVAYNNGQGAPQDYKEAVKWFTLAAEQGHAEAQYNLGEMYREGEEGEYGLIKDYKKAVKWYRLAAEQGHADAQAGLGFMYTEGQGILQNYVYAHMWLNIAASSGAEGGAINRDRVAELMPPSKIEKAQELALECIRKQYKGC